MKNPSPELNNAANRIARPNEKTEGRRNPSAVDRVYGDPDKADMFLNGELSPDERRIRAQLPNGEYPILPNIDTKLPPALETPPEERRRLADLLRSAENADVEKATLVTEERVFSETEEAERIESMKENRREKIEDMAEEKLYDSKGPLGKLGVRIRELFNGKGS